MDRIVFEHTLSLFWFLLPSHSSVQLVHSIVPIIHYFFQKKKKKVDAAGIEQPHFSSLGWSDFAETQLDSGS